jgi:hypothetical protein
MHRLEIALIGFPGSGKTTLWNLLTGNTHPTGDYMGRGHVEMGVFMLPDDRLDRFCAVLSSKKKVPFHADVHDVAGLISMEGGRASVSDELLSTVRNADVIVLVLRAFASPGHPGGEHNPKKELDSLIDELHFRDINLLDSRIHKLEDTVKKAVPNRDELYEELELCRNLLPIVESGKRPDITSFNDAQRKKLNGYRLSSLANILVFLNTSAETTPGSFSAGDLPVAAYPAALEAELAGFEGADEAAMRKDLGLETSLAKVFTLGLRQALGLIFFYTGSEKECNAWALRNGDNALEAASTIHSDIAKGFIRAEVTPVDAIIQHGGAQAAKKANAMHEEGKGYVVKDGDYFNVRFSK